MEFEQIVAAEPTNVIISGFEHFLAYYSPALYNKKMFFYADNNNVSELVSRLCEQGIFKFSVSSAKSIISKLKIEESTLLNLRIPYQQGRYMRIYPVIERYRDEQRKKGLVLTVFEMREEF